jgi:cold shock CspA family protein
MTGKIKTLSAGCASGYIKAASGVTVFFHRSVIQPKETAALAIGQDVTFDIQEGHPPTAINLFLREKKRMSEGEKRRLAAVQIRYLGFDQKGSSRCYKFQGISAGDHAISCVISTDLALFAKHNIGIQDGPVLCLEILGAERQAAGVDWRPPSSRFLTDQDMLAHLARQPARAPRFRPRKVVAGPTATPWRGPQRRP